MGKLGSPAPPHGTRARYRLGCGCELCRDANTIRRRTDARVRVQKLSEPPADGPGPVEQAVADALEGLSVASERPELAATALAMARVLDGPIPSPKPGAAGKLTDVMDRLRKGSELRKSGLAAVRQMSRPTG